MDLILSSGFLAFAHHVGFLQGVRARGVAVDAIVGTSSGALVGTLFAAGHAPEKIGQTLSEQAPIEGLRMNAKFWRGLFSLDSLIARLQEELPARFEDLPIPVAVGVVDESGTYRLMTSGSLPQIVAASCAMPYVFEPIAVDGEQFRDGGAADRLGISAWRGWRPDRAALVHHVARTRGVDADFDDRNLTFVRSPRSGASLWNLGDFGGQVAASEARTIRAIGA